MMTTFEMILSIAGGVLSLTALAMACLYVYQALVTPRQDPHIVEYYRLAFNYLTLASVMMIASFVFTDVALASGIAFGTMAVVTLVLRAFLPRAINKKIKEQH